MTGTRRGGASLNSPKIKTTEAPMWVFVTVTTVKLTPVSEDMDDDVNHAFQEKINQIIRDYLAARITAVTFRRALRDTGIIVNQEVVTLWWRIMTSWWQVQVERLISAHERDGLVTFNDLKKTVGYQLKGETTYQFQQEPLTTTAWVLLEISPNFLMIFLQNRTFKGVPQ